MKRLRVSDVIEKREHQIEEGLHICGTRGLHSNAGHFFFPINLLSMDDTGLDSLAALMIASLLRNFCNEGMMVLCTM